MLSIRWILLMLVALGCARGPNVGSGQLPLRRVVVYRNGVGYFERAGSVDDEVVSFRMRQRMVGDFLASLAVIERGGSSVRSASFPLEVEDTETPAADEPTPRPLTDKSSPSIAPPSVPPEPPKKRADPNAMRDVLLHLDGKEHELLIGYLSETPVWRPSYRVVISEEGAADLQAWGIVQNLSGEDWLNVNLSLVAGAPLAFQSTLGTPVIPQRPIVTDEGEVMAVVPIGVTSLNKSDDAAAMDRYGPESGYGAAAPAGGAADVASEERMEAEAKDEDLKQDSRRRPAEEQASARGAMGAVKKSAPPRSMPSPVMQAAPAPPPPPSLSAPRKLSNLAAVAEQGGTTRYDIPHPVTVPNESATMVLLASQRVPGEAVLLFAPEPGVPNSASHPFRVARFTNSTSGLLERGPIAVFERGSFLGQGMLDPLPPRATATVPFALERSVAIARDYRQDEQGARLFRIEAGRLLIERDFINRTIYRADNGSDRRAKLLVKHPRIPGTRLFKPPPGTEDNTATASALLPAELGAHKKVELTVDERRAAQQDADWLGPLANEAVTAYLADARANPALAAKLREVWSIRDVLRRSLDEVEKLTNERSELERSSEETRRNLKAIEKNPQALDLRQKLTRRLTDASARLDAITKRAIELGMSTDEQQVRFRDAIRDLKLDAPLPPTN